jgi:hypothetical protein
MKASKKRNVTITESCFTTGVPVLFPAMAASSGYVHSCSRGIGQRLALSVSFKYTGMFAIKSFW